MIYTTEDNKIIVKDKSQFNPKHILECGQIFCYQKQKDYSYVVYSADKKACLVEFDDRIEIQTQDVPYFVNFFDLNTDYSLLKQNFIKEYPYLKSAITFGGGIRILKQDPFETIIGFIVSANNNIKRIQKIMFSLRERFGNKMGDYNAFPTAKQLISASIEDLLSIGLGYRAKYIYTACRQLNDVDYNLLANLPTNELNLKLLQIMGVGQKVADCIMLFAFSKGDVFPVDTWIEKVYCTYFEEEHNRKIIRQNLLNRFGNYSGYIQQYLFYSQREGA